MLKSLQKAAAVVALVFYALAGALLEVSHRDDLSLPLFGLPLLVSHDCGDKEIHLPVDKLQPCPACMYSMRRVAIPVTPLYIIGERLHWTRFSLILSEPSLAIDFLYSDERAPPLES